MGAVPFDGGVTFRVWAPNATAAVVAIKPGGPGTAQVQLAQDANGTWSIDTDQAHVGDAYQYVFTSPSSPPPRVDPRALSTVDTGAAQDATAAIVTDIAALDWGDGVWRAPGWTELVIYELHVGSFNPQPPEAVGSFDEQPPEAVGTFDDVVVKLPYLRDLGITAIELLPVAGFEGDVSWGYDPGVPFSVARAYGGIEGLSRLVAAAHDCGIAVLLDVVLNHFGPDDSILWQFDGSGPGWEGGVYFYGSRFAGDPRPQTPWGSRPDYGRPEVRQYLQDSVLMRLQSCRLDGLRFDATSYIRSIDGSGSADEAIPDGWLLLQEINDAIDDSQPWKLTVAEDMRGSDAITSPTSAGGAGFDAQWDPDFVRGVRAVLEAVDDGQRSMAWLAGMLTARLGPRAISRVVFTESHDADGNGRTRVPTEIDPLEPDSSWSRKRSTLGAVLTLTAPGIPMLFQGQEFLEQEAFLDHPVPLDWGNVTKYAGIVDLYRDLIRMRRNWNNCTAGLRGDSINVFHVNDWDKVIAYHRFDQGGPGDDVVVVANFANRGYDSYSIGFPQPGTWQVRFNSDWSGYGADYGNWPSYAIDTAPGERDGFGQAGSVGVGPYTAIILSQDR
jgi:1,4-alpha-glucan branching enzyme